MKIVFCLIVGVWLLAVVSGVFELRLANRAVAGENIAPSVLSASDTRQMFMGWVQWTLWVAGAIAFIMWLYRAYQNVDATDPGRRRYGHGWAIGSWFVPILNLWRPEADRQRCLARRAEPRGPGLPADRVVAAVARQRLRRVLRAAASTTTPARPRSGRPGSSATSSRTATGAVAALLAVLVAIKLTRNLNARAQAADGSLFRDSSREAPTDAPSVMTMTPSDTPTGR